MNKAEMVDAMAAKTGMTKTDTRKALDAFIAAATKAMAKGDKVTLVGFGTFSVNNRAATTGRNPRTGEAIKIPAKKVVRFKPGNDLSNKCQ